MTENKLITSKAILEQTGISRATLNNYIKLGILPRPIISSPGPDQQGVKQIGYFPTESLMWITQVKLLKQQGNSMEQIAGMFADKEWVKAISATTSVDIENKQQAEKQQMPLNVNRYTSGSGQKQPQHEEPQESVTTSRHTGKSGLKVTINDLTSPAYLVNNNFEIEWINEEAEQLLFHREISSVVNIEYRNIFKLLLDRNLHGVMQNWKDALDLHCTLLQRHLDDDNLQHVFDGITADEIAVINNSYRNRQPPATDNLYHVPFSFVSAASGSRQNFFVHSTAYREGTFLVFVPADQNTSHVMNMLAQREKIINELLTNRMPSMVSLCALVASLQNSERVCAELLPSQYFLLINELWQTVGPVFEKYSGIYGKHRGSNMLYYFVKTHGNDYLINSINCAMELSEVMSVFSNKWKIHKGWGHDLYLNIGIHEGREFLGTVHSGGNIEFTTLGDSVKVAGQLSEFADNGEIWVTKDIISKMSNTDRQGFNFGVYRNQEKGKIFQQDSFSLAEDLIDADLPHPSLFTSISKLAIAEITKRIDTL